jgi:hypothetical protein
MSEFDMFDNLSEDYSQWHRDFEKDYTIAGKQAAREEGMRRFHEATRDLDALSSEELDKYTGNPENEETWKLRAERGARLTSDPNGRYGRAAIVDTPQSRGHGLSHNDMNREETEVWARAVEEGKQGWWTGKAEESRVMGDMSTSELKTQEQQAIADRNEYLRTGHWPNR